MDKHKKKSKTEKELDDGLRLWVAQYIFTRSTGLTILSGQIKRNIDKAIKSKKLKRGKVWFCFGDPDAPDSDTKDKVRSFLGIKKNFIETVDTLTDWSEEDKADWEEYQQWSCKQQGISTT